MAIRLFFLVVAVVAVGFMMGTFNSKTLKSVTSHIPRVPHTPLQDKKAEYRKLVESDFTRLRPLNSAFFSGCSPDPKVAGTCAALSEQMLGALRSFQLDLENAPVPDSFGRAHSTLRRAVAKGIEGFTDVQRAVRAHRRAEWFRARDALGASDALVQRAYEQLPALERPQSWGY
jgi:hypothetical protein